MVPVGGGATECRCCICFAASSSQPSATVPELPQAARSGKTFRGYVLGGNSSRQNTSYLVKEDVKIDPTPGLPKGETTVFVLFRSVWNFQQSSFYCVVGESTCTKQINILM